VKLFGTRSVQSLFGLTLIALALGCGRNSDMKQVSGDVKTRIPWTEEGGSYSLKEILLKGISSLYELSGDFATFYVYPSVQGSKITGTNPKTRFLKAGELYVPEDTMTQQMTTIYAHLQELAAMDVEMGAAGVNTWPRDVGVAVRYTMDGAYAVNNAFYDGITDSMLVVPYTDENNLPIPVNAGILAHEHFHSLYFKLVEKKVFSQHLATHGQNIRQEVLGDSAAATADSKKIERFSKTVDSESYHEQFSRGINEGLADFWAWVYTGDPDFLASSLPSEKTARSLSLSSAPSDFVTAALYKHRLENVFSRSDVGEQCLGGRVVYCLGSEYARALKYLGGIVQDGRGLTPRQSRAVVAKAVIAALPLLRDDLLAMKGGDLFEPVKFFAMVQKNLPDLQDKEKSFLETLVKNTLSPKVSFKEVTIDLRSSPRSSK
jgi:hypothetical protein